ncbi:MAG: leucine-rich repeat domain-containing protein, partial [Bacteroidota bacterium]
LNLRDNLLDSLPSWFSKWDKLEHLNLSGNPIQFASLPACDSLILQDMDQLPFQLPKSMTYLDLSGWSSPIPPLQLGTLESLETLVLKHPKNLDWTGLFDLLSKAKQLKTLVIADHDLLVFPNGIERLEQLQLVMIEGHRLEALPLGIQKSKRLKEIHIAQCPDLKPDFVFSQLLASRKMRAILWLDQVDQHLQDTLSELIQPSIFYWKELKGGENTSLPKANQFGFDAFPSLEVRKKPQSVNDQLQIQGIEPGYLDLRHFNAPIWITDQQIPLWVDSTTFKTYFEVHSLTHFLPKEGKPFPVFDLDVLIDEASDNLTVFHYDPISSSWQSKGSDYLLDLEELGTLEVRTSINPVEISNRPVPPKALQMEQWTLGYQQKKKALTISLEREKNTDALITYPELDFPTIDHWRFVGDNREIALDVLKSHLSQESLTTFQAVEAPYRFSFDRSAGHFLMQLTSNSRDYELPVVPVFVEKEDAEYAQQVLQWWKHYSQNRSAAERERLVQLQAVEADQLAYESDLAEWQSKMEGLAALIAPDALPGQQHQALWHRFRVQEPGYYLLGNLIDYPHDELAVRIINPNGTIAPAKAVWLVDVSNKVYSAFPPTAVPIDFSAHFLLLIETASGAFIFLDDNQFRKQDIDLTTNTIWIKAKNWKASAFSAERLKELVEIN